MMVMAEVALVAVESWVAVAVLGHWHSSRSSTLVGTRTQPGGAAAERAPRVAPARGPITVLGLKLGEVARSAGAQPRALDVHYIQGVRHGAAVLVASPTNPKSCEHGGVEVVHVRVVVLPVVQLLAVDEVENRQVAP